MRLIPTVMSDDVNGVLNGYGLGRNLLFETDGDCDSGYDCGLVMMGLVKETWRKIVNFPYVPLRPVRHMRRQQFLAVRMHGSFPSGFLLQSNTRNLGRETFCLLFACKEYVELVRLWTQVFWVDV